ncbi:MAG: hypothetical protein PHQ59_04275 [Candidatus Daviesbacteria bacterium]|nr:hypothetical protein [Candidatus Daviesbacteria bacterium]
MPVVESEAEKTPVATRPDMGDAYMPQQKDIQSGGKENQGVFHWFLKTSPGKALLTAAAILGLAAVTNASDTREFDKTPVDSAAAMATRTASDKNATATIVANEQLSVKSADDIKKAQPEAVQTQQATNKTP